MAKKPTQKKTSEAAAKKRRAKTQRKVTPKGKTNKTKRKNAMAMKPARKRKTTVTTWHKDPKNGTAVAENDASAETRGVDDGQMELPLGEPKGGIPEFTERWKDAVEHRIPDLEIRMLAQETFAAGLELEEVTSGEIFNHARERVAASGWVPQPINETVEEDETTTGHGGDETTTGRGLDSNIEG